MFCKNCGKELPEGSLVCGYCGTAIPQEQLSESAKEELRKNANADESLKPNHSARIRLVGIILMVISGIVDLISIAMVGTSDLGAFKAVLIIGGVTFVLGLFLTFAFRG